MLFRRHKDGAPVPRGDLTALCLKAYKDKRQLGPYVVAAARLRFLRVLGLEMRALVRVAPAETDVRKKVAAASGDKAAVPCFVLRSALPAGLRAAFVDTEAGAPAKGLLLVVLALVAIAGEAGLTEAALWAQLGALGVAKGDKAHPALGDVDAALEALLKQRYLQRSRAGEEKRLELAENGRDEVGAPRVAEFIQATMAMQGVGPAGHAAVEEVEIEDD